jgi:hypothetical protein
VKVLWIANGETFLIKKIVWERSRFKFFKLLNHFNSFSCHQIYLENAANIGGRLEVSSSFLLSSLSLPETDAD